jgi:hypothetical protein
MEINAIGSEKTIEINEIESNLTASLNIRTELSFKYRRESGQI